MVCHENFNECDVANYQKDQMTISKTVTTQFGSFLIKANITNKGYSLTIFNKQSKGCENFYLKTSERDGSFTGYYKMIDAYGKTTYNYNSGNEQYCPPTPESITRYIPNRWITPNCDRMYHNQYNPEQCPPDPCRQNQCPPDPCRQTQCPPDPCVQNQFEQDPCVQNQFVQDPCVQNQFVQDP